MAIEEIKLKIEEWLAPALQEKNLFLVDTKISMGKKIEVYVDSDEGIHIDDCATLSRLLEQHLDGSGLVPENYILEVSSPGMTNPLRVPRQYKKRIGRMLEVTKTTGEVILAKLTQADENGIVLSEEVNEKKKKMSNRQMAALLAEGKTVEEEKPETKEYEVRYDAIKKAVLHFDF